MPTILIVTLGLLTVLALALMVPSHMTRRRLDFRGQILDLLATGARRGVPIDRLLAEAAPEHRGRKRRLLANLSRDLRAGAPLSRALTDHGPQVFPPRVVAAVRGCEGSAQFAAILRALANDATRSVTARHRLSMTMLYPICLGTVLIGLQSFYLEILDAGSAASSAGGTAGSLWPSRAIHATGVLVLGTALLAALYRLLGARVGALHRMVDAGVRRLPALDRLSRLAGAERLLRSTAALVSTGAPLPDALRRAAPATGNQRFAHAALDAAARMERGETPDEAWGRTALPPFAAVRAAMASTKEGTDLAIALGSLAEEAGARRRVGIERGLRWVHPAAALVFGCLLAAQFAAVFQMIHRFQQEARLW